MWATALLCMEVLFLIQQKWTCKVQGLTSESPDHLGKCNAIIAASLARMSLNHPWHQVRKRSSQKESTRWWPDYQSSVSLTLSQTLREEQLGTFN